MSFKIKVKKGLEKGAVRYAEATQLRTVVNLIPGFGSAVDVLISNEGQKIQYRRITTALEILRQEMNDFDEKKIDEDYLTSEEFYDLLLKYFDKISKARQLDKIRLFSKILVNSISVENVTERQFAEDVMDFLSDLSLLDLKVALALYSQQKDYPDKFDEKENTELKFVIRTGFHEIRPKLELNEIDFDTSLRKLERAGLVKEIVGMYFGYNGGLYSITRAFIRLMNFLKTNANQPTFSLSFRE